MQDGIDSRYAWLRLSVTLALMTIGATGMFVISVALPAVQADFGIDRSSVSSAYTMLMIGFGLGGILMGRLADRFGVAVPVAIGAFGLGGGFIAAGLAPGGLRYKVAVAASWAWYSTNSVPSGATSSPVTVPLAGQFGPNLVLEGAPAPTAVRRLYRHKLRHFLREVVAASVPRHLAGLSTRNEIMQALPLSCPWMVDKLD